MVDVKCLSDYELQYELTKLGFSPGPILPSTRKVYEKKLVQLLISPPCASPGMNGPEELDRAQDDDDSEGTLRADHSWSLPGPRVGQSCGLWDPGASVPLTPAPTGTFSRRGWARRFLQSVPRLFHSINI
uniref:LEM domain containing 1 n=1 Tax=Ailuropoda melanoleuca TaxID=9646 RepID=A0A7N5JDU4_AILME